MRVLKETYNDSNYDFEGEVNFDPENMVITGNRDFQSFGDDTLIQVIKGDYYDDEVGYDYETLEMLEKLTGKKWNETTIRGYSQSDWQNVYYSELVSREHIKTVEIFYFGLLKEYVDEDYCSYLIPDYIAWKGKAAIEEYLGETFDKILEISGQHIEYTYKEI